MELEDVQEDDPSDELWEEIKKTILADRHKKGFGPEAQSVLDSGRPIYVEDPKYLSEIMKIYPDGRREIVTFDEHSEEVSVRKLRKLRNPPCNPL